MDSQSNESRLRLAEEALQKNGFKKVDDVWVAPSAYSHELTAEAVLVKWQHKVPICDIKGDCIGYTDWIDGNAKLKAWPSRALYTAPPGVVEGVPVAWYCVNVVTGKMLYTDSESQMNDMREANSRHWQITPLYTTPLAVVPQSVGCGEPLGYVSQYVESAVKSQTVYTAQIRATKSKGFPIPIYTTLPVASVTDVMTSALMEYFKASVAFNNSQGDGPEGESLLEAVERSNKAEARFEAATQAAHIAMRAHLKTGAA